MRAFEKHIELVLPTLLLFTIILVIPQLSNSNLMLPTQNGKAFGFLWGMLEYIVVVIFIATINKKTHTIRITPIDLFLGAYCLMIGISYWFYPLYLLAKLYNETIQAEEIGASYPDGYTPNQDKVYICGLQYCAYSYGDCYNIL